MTEESLWREVSAESSDLMLGLSRGSYCKQREAKRSSSVPSEFEKWPSRQESMSTWEFFALMRSSACTNADSNIIMS